MCTDKLLEDLLLFEEAVAYSLEVFDGDLRVLTRLEDGGVVVHGLLVVGELPEVVLLGIFTGGSEEALEGEDGQIRGYCFLQQSNVIEEVAQTIFLQRQSYFLGGGLLVRR